MILAIDVGNSETTIGLLAGERVISHWRVTTVPGRTPDELGLLLTTLLRSDDRNPAITGSAIGSVVPQVTAPLAEACVGWLGSTPIIVDARSRLPITLDVEDPLTVGADRIINTLAASRLYRCDAIVVDLGTATTYDCITADAVFLGGVIAPGVRSAAETLFRRTSKLPATELIPPIHVIGRRTEECMRAGVVYGAAAAIDGIVRRIKAEWPRSQIPLVVATGGLAEGFRSLCEEFDRVEPHLTLHGLGMAHALLTA
ncbi:MAG: type III pantothenate kinase [Gemmatimonadaceae bacterium]